MALTRRNPGRLNVWAATLALLACSLLAAYPASAQLARVGPIDRGHGYPQWYQDKTGLTMEFCDNRTQAELEGGWCILLPPDVPSGQAPEVFPTNFVDEHFYWLLNAGDRLVPVPGTPNTAVVGLVAGLEGAFAVGPPIAGDQIVFARVRIKITPLPYDGNYTVYTPFGVFPFPNQVAGDKIFFTEDIGITTSDFTGALNGHVYPFLAPSAVPGGPEMPPVSADNPTPDQDPAHFGGAFAPTPYPGNGRKYIADPARLGPITGSLQAPFNFNDGRNGVDPNIFRVEGPNGFVFETTDFTLGGRIFEGGIPGDLHVQRASYTRDTTGQNIAVDVYATGTPATQGRLPGSPAPAVQPTQMSYYEAACTATLDANGIPGAPYSVPANPGAPIQMFGESGRFYGRSTPAALPSDVCVVANSVNAAGQTVPAYLPAHVGDQVFISEAKYDGATQSMSVKASSSDAFLNPILTVQGFGNIANGQLIVNPILAAPDRVVVLSQASGINSRQVYAGAVSGGTIQVPVANNDSANTTEDTPLAAIAVLANDTNAAGGTVAIASQGLLGTATANANGTITYTPNANANGSDSFTYTVTVAGQTSNTATVSVSIAPVNDAPVAVNDTANALRGVANSFNALANDTDPDGLADLSGGQAAAVIVTGDANLGIAAGASFANGLITYTPPANAVAGTYTVTYRTMDATGTLSANTASLRVALSSTEQITPARAQFTQKTLRWVITGTDTPAAGQTVTITYVNGIMRVNGACPNVSNTAGLVVGTAVVDATATYTFDQILTSGIGFKNPSNTGNSAGFWCTPPSAVRMTSSLNPANPTSAVFNISLK